MQNYVFVLDANRQPLSPCHPSVARKLLKGRRAAVYRRFPFTIILKEAKPSANPLPIQLKIDPGSKTTGIALMQEDKVIFCAELTHRGAQIKAALDARRSVRGGRRSRNTRYRQARFLNRTRPKGWLAPSLKSRVDNLQTWFIKFYKLCSLASISMELVRFDMQLMENAEVSGVEYQQGELAGYEVREYLLEKFGRKCSYCGKRDVALEVEHITPKSRGGSNRVSNLCLACHECNTRKGTMTAAEFGHPEVQALAKKPLKDATAVNSVRWAVFNIFKATGLPIEVGTGGRTKFNRTKQDYPKAHWIDAACVGTSGENVIIFSETKPLLINATGHGRRQMCITNKHGFPVNKPKTRNKDGWKTGDLASAHIKSGKHSGTYKFGRVTAKADGVVFLPSGWEYKNRITVNQKYLLKLHSCDGYSYQ